MAREFWIAGKSDGSLSAHELPCEDMSGYYRAVKVREVDPKESDWKKLCEELVQTLERANQISDSVINRFDTEQITKMSGDFSSAYQMFYEHLQVGKLTLWALAHYRKAMEGK